MMRQDWARHAPSLSFRRPRTVVDALQVTRVQIVRPSTNEVHKCTLSYFSHPRAVGTMDTSMHTVTCAIEVRVSHASAAEE